MVEPAKLDLSAVDCNMSVGSMAPDSYRRVPPDWAGLGSSGLASTGNVGREPPRPSSGAAAAAGGAAAAADAEPGRGGLPALQRGVSLQELPRVEREVTEVVFQEKHGQTAQRFAAVGGALALQSPANADPVTVHEVDWTARALRVVHSAGETRLLIPSRDTLTVLSELRELCGRCSCPTNIGATVPVRGAIGIKTPQKAEPDYRLGDAAPDAVRDEPPSPAPAADEDSEAGEKKLVSMAKYNAAMVVAALVYLACVIGEQQPVPASLKAIFALGYFIQLLWMQLVILAIVIYQQTQSMHSTCTEPMLGPWFLGWAIPVVVLIPLVELTRRRHLHSTQLAAQMAAERAAEAAAERAAAEREQRLGPKRRRSAPPQLVEMQESEPAQLGASGRSQSRPPVDDPQDAPFLAAAAATERARLTSEKEERGWLSRTCQGDGKGVRPCSFWLQLGITAAIALFVLAWTVTGAVLVYTNPDCGDLSTYGRFFFALVWTLCVLNLGQELVRHCHQESLKEDEENWDPRWLLKG